MAIFPAPIVPGYTQVTLAQALAALGDRLEDTTNIYWSQEELRLYLTEAIRTWQAYTGWYRSSYRVPVSAGVNWYDIGSYTVTDTQLISTVLYHLLEAQLVNNRWAGTGQFNLSIVQHTLRNRVNRYLSDTGVVSTRLVQAAPTGVTGRVLLQPNTIDVRRVVWAAQSTSRVLWRGDEWGLNSFSRNWMQPVITGDVPIDIAINGVLRGAGITVNGVPVDPLGLASISINGTVVANPVPTGPINVNGIPVGSGVLVNGVPLDPTGTASIAINGKVVMIPPPEPSVPYQGPPQVYSVAATPPVSLQLGPPPAVVGNLDLVVVQSGPQLSLGPSVLGVPDDLAWGVKWGVLADLLSRDGQAKDPTRALYCEQRYREAVELAALYPTIVQTAVNGVPVFTGSVFDMDAFANGWQNAPAGTPTAAGLVGRNLLALSPAPANGAQVYLDMVVNIPVPVLAGDYLQVPPDVIPAILDYAQHLASFKMGGSEFAVTDQQRTNLLYEAANYNSRLRQANFYNAAVRNLASRQQAQVPRIDMVKANG